MSVATLIMKGVEAGECQLDENVCELLGPIAGRSTVRVDELLSHRSGLPNWRPYLDWLFERYSDSEPGSEEVIELTQMWTAGEPTVYVPGSRSLYSDLGYMLLGWWLEKNMKVH